MKTIHTIINQEDLLASDNGRKSITSVLLTSDLTFLSINLHKYVFSFFISSVLTPFLVFPVGEDMMRSKLIINKDYVSIQVFIAG